MRNHFFEVPFIANYRKEYVKPELDLYDLWKIWLWDEKVCVGKRERKHGKCVWGEGESVCGCVLTVVKEIWGGWSGNHKSSP